jgi:hypothetical protein
VAHVRVGSRLCENSDVELARRTFVSITLNRNSTGSHSRRWTREKTILRILCSRTFSHSLGHSRRCRAASVSGHVRYAAESGSELSYRDQVCSTALARSPQQVSQAWLALPTILRRSLRPLVPSGIGPPKLCRAVRHVVLAKSQHCFCRR